MSKSRKPPASCGAKKPPAGDMIRDAVRQALECQCINQAELSRRSGVSPPNVSRFLRSQSDVTTAVANRLLAALGLVLRSKEEK
jgi:plasmid maintenance system antidote protein VapI